MNKTGDKPVVVQPYAWVCPTRAVLACLCLLPTLLANCNTSTKSTSDTVEPGKDTLTDALLGDGSDAQSHDVDDPMDSTHPDGPMDEDSKPPPNCDMDDDLILSIECGGEDCDDQDPTIHPLALEVCNNAVDEDCSGTMNDRDIDGDGYTDPMCGGTDCRDDLSWIHPNAADFVSGFCVAPTQWNHISPQTVEKHGYWPQLAFDANNRMHIVHHDSSSDQLIYMSNADDDSATNWSHMPASPPGTGGSNSSLILDPDGNAHVSFLDYALGSLRYATNAGGAWSSTIVDSSKMVGWFSSLGRDQSGRLHVVYRDSNIADLRYATCDQKCSGSEGSLSGWITSTVDHEGDVGKFSSLVVFPDGRLAIAYQDITNERLKLAKAPSHSGPWTHEIIEEMPGTGWSVDLQRGPDDSLSVSYINQELDLLMFASNGSGKWEAQACAIASLDTFTGQRTSLAIDSTGLPHIAFTHDVGHPLRYTGCRERCGSLCCPGQWQTVTVNPTEGTGGLVDMVLDRQGMLSIVHRHGKENQLIISHTTCIESPLDSNCDGVDGEDHDNDGFASVETGGLDCDDSNIKISPNADDPPGDGIDANCDGTDCGSNCIYPCETDCDCTAMDAPFPAPCDASCESCGNYWQCVESQCVAHCGEIPPEIQACAEPCVPINCTDDGYVPVDTDLDGCFDLCVFNTGCGGKCGQSLPYGLCQCTAECIEAGNCCKDFCEMCINDFPDACCKPNCVGKPPGGSNDCGGTCDGPPVSGSCWKKCGQFDGNEPCQCNPECMDDQTCCADFCDKCAGEFPAACCSPNCDGKPKGALDGCGGVCTNAPSGSCIGKCGESNGTWSCQCDALCSKAGNCCSNFCDACADVFPEMCCMPNCTDQSPGSPDGCGGQCGNGIPDTNTCKGKCGLQDSLAACQCHPGCLQEGTCCADICIACPSTTGPECCVPDCVDTVSGAPDGCGGTCNICVPTCLSVPPGQPDGCGGVCKPCDPTTDPMCCVPNCEGKKGGVPDGCGAFCKGSNPEPPPTNGKIELEGSCAGLCGQLDTSLPCQCDALCFLSNDCCIDICSECSDQFTTECDDQCFCPHPQVWHDNACCTRNCDGTSCGNDDGCGGVCECTSTHLCDKGKCTKTPADCVPVQSVTCGDILSGLSNNTIGVSNALETYSCIQTSDVDYSNGNELVFSFNTDVEQVVHISSENAQWLDLFVLEGKEGGCKSATKNCIYHDNQFGVFKTKPNQNYFLVWDTWTTNRVEDFSMAIECCTPDCTDKMCGHDGCGDSCGDCPDGIPCLNNTCCLPQCDGIQCGNDDGCGSKCSCAMGTSCSNGVCSPAPTTCTPLQSVSCGDLVTAQGNAIQGATFAFDSYSCKNNTPDDQFGLSNELVYSFTVTDSTAAKIVSTDNQSMYVMVLKDAGSGCVDDGANCIAQDPHVAAFDATAGDTYYIIWDSNDGTEVQDFGFEIQCCQKTCLPGLCGKSNGCGGTCGCGEGSICQEGGCCQPQCSGAECDNGCGGYCGVGLSCGDIGPQGACANGQLMHCQNGVLQQVNCGMQNKLCGYDTSMKKYLCL